MRVPPFRRSPPPCRMMSASSDLLSQGVFLPVLEIQTRLICSSKELANNLWSKLPQTVCKTHNKRIRRVSPGNYLRINWQHWSGDWYRIWLVPFLISVGPINLNRWPAVTLLVANTHTPPQTHGAILKSFLCVPYICNDHELASVLEFRSLSS